MFPLVLFYPRFLVKIKISFYNSSQFIILPEIKNRSYGTSKDLASWEGRGFQIGILIRKHLPY